MEVFIGYIAMFGFNFPPRGWMLCQGQSISIASNTALFSLIGTYYGGNGTTTFNLPDLRGRVALGQGQGPGLSPYTIGQVAGTEQTTLTQANLPAHNHFMMASGNAAAQSSPSGGSLPTPRSGDVYATGASNPVTMASATTPAGGGQPVGIMQPYLCINYCIAMQGIFPSRN